MKDIMKSKNKDYFNYIISNIDDLNFSIDDNERNLLFECRDVNCANKFLELGVDPLLKDKKGWNLIYVYLFTFFDEVLFQKLIDMGVDIKSQEKEIIDKVELSYEKTIFFEKNGLELKPEYFHIYTYVDYLTKKERSRYIKLLNYLKDKDILPKMNVRNLSLDGLLKLKDEKEYKTFLNLLAPYNKKLDVYIRHILERKHIDLAKRIEYVDYIFDKFPSIEIYNYINKNINNTKSKFSDMKLTDEMKEKLQKILDKYSYLKDIDKFDI